MYARLSRCLCVEKTRDQFSCALPMVGADAVQLDVVVFVIPAATTLTINIQGSNDLANWASLGTTTTTTVGYVSAAKVTNIQWKHIRVRMSSNTAGIAILAIGANTARLGSSPQGATTASRKTYTRVATQLSVTAGADQASPAISMWGANSAQVDFVVFVGPGTNKVTVTLQGSNDLENWSNLNLGSTVGVGFNSSLKQGDIAFQFVRLRFSVTGGTTPSILAAGVNAVAA